MRGSNRSGNRQAEKRTAMSWIGPLALMGGLALPGLVAAESHESKRTITQPPTTEQLLNWRMSRWPELSSSKSDHETQPCIAREDGGARGQNETADAGEDSVGVKNPVAGSVQC